MNIRIIGSMSFYNEFIRIKDELEALGHTIYMPVKYHNGESQDHRKRAIERFNGELDICEAVLVVNPDKGGIKHYIGIGVAIEIGMAIARKKKIFMLNAPVGEVADYYRAISYVSLDGDAKKIY